MGLSAGQARLLTITGRKSDCEFESMRLSHQKIALARDLADLSNEYQNSLNQTKLIYDYYGTGDINTPLTYGVLMTPSALNDYMPTTITDSAGRVVLNGKYAAAARAAGIPQEGLGTLPGEVMRNNFILSLSDTGLITQSMADTITSLPYNQQAGFGGGATIVTQTADVTLAELTSMLKNYSVDNPTESVFNSSYVREMVFLNCSDTEGNEAAAHPNDNRRNNKTIAASNSNGNPVDMNGYHGLGQDLYSYNDNRGGYAVDRSGSEMSELTFKDILEGNYVLVSVGRDEQNYAIGLEGGAIDAISNSVFWNQLYDVMESILDTGDVYTQKALEYAKSKLNYLTTWQGGNRDKGGSKWQHNNDESTPNFAYRRGGSYEWTDYEVFNHAVAYADQEDTLDGTAAMIGMNMMFNCGEGRDNNSDISAISINLSTAMQAYLTYFADFMNGISTTDAFGKQVYEVNSRVSTSKLVNSDTLFTIKTGTEVSSDELAYATFYDALFNQICSSGWTENNSINDSEYLQQMLQSGMMYISKMKDDGYYYQGNYSVDSYIKEITDESKIAAAEAKYNTEKAKLNAKEETLDLKMKNLDTEISSLTTEYDAVKNTISKNVERCFKRYSA